MRIEPTDKDMKKWIDNINLSNKNIIFHCKEIENLLIKVLKKLNDFEKKSKTTDIKIALLEKSLKNLEKIKGRIRHLENIQPIDPVLG